MSRTALAEEAPLKATAPRARAPESEAATARPVGASRNGSQRDHLAVQRTKGNQAAIAMAQRRASGTDAKHRPGAGRETAEVTPAAESDLAEAKELNVDAAAPASATTAAPAGGAPPDSPPEAPPGTPGPPGAPAGGAPPPADAPGAGGDGPPAAGGAPPSAPPSGGPAAPGGNSPGGGPAGGSGTGTGAPAGNGSNEPGGRRAGPGSAIAAAGGAAALATTALATTALAATAGPGHGPPRFAPAGPSSPGGPAGSAASPLHAGILTGLSAQAKGAAALPAPKTAAGSPTGPTAGGAAGGGPAAGQAPTAADRAAILAGRPAGPAADPGFAAMHAKVAGAGHAAAAHPTVPAAVGSAHAAAEMPSGDKESQANTAKAGDMAAAKEEPFDRKKFVDKVLAKVTELTPTTTEDVDKFKSQGRPSQIKAAVKGDVGPEARKSTGDLKTQSDKPPDLSKATEKQVTPLAPPAVPAPPAGVGAPGAMPPPAPPAATDLSAGPAQVQDKMASAKVTDEQLRKANEPTFSKAADSKTKLEQHAATAPGKVRKEEKAKLESAKVQAASIAGSGLATMHQTAAGKHAESHGKKADAKAKEEDDRKALVKEINDTFDLAKTDVEKILVDLDTEVDAVFDAGAKAAADAFASNVEARKDQIKHDMSWAEWFDSMLVTPSPKLKEAYTGAKGDYIAQMRGVVERVAGKVEEGMRKAKQRIAKAQGDIAALVGRQPASLQKVAQEAAAGLTEKFSELTQSVNEKQNDIIDRVADKYVAARKEVDDKIKEMEAADKGLLDMAMDDINGVIDAVMKLKDMLLQTLQRAAAAIDRIIEDPIGFLEKLVNAVKNGFMSFGRNILEHLKTGFFEWILGPIKEMGVEIPTDFNLPSLFKLVIQVIGVSWDQIKQKIMAKLPPPVAQILELGLDAINSYKEGGGAGVKKLAMDKLPPAVRSIIDMINRVRTGGIAALWEIVGEKLQDLKRMVIDKIKDFLIEKVIKAGIEWVLSLCNPAGAFIKAVELIVKVVSFFVDNAAKIKAVVDQILDGIEDILDGGGGVAIKVENALASMIPMVIEFIASLLGFGGIGAKVQEIIKSVRGAIDKAIDWVIGKIFTALKWIWDKIKSGAAAIKDKVMGGDKAKGKEEAKKPGDDGRTPEQKQAAVDAAADEAEALIVSKTADDLVVDPANLDVGLAAIRTKHKLEYLEYSLDAEDPGHAKFDIEAKINPVKTKSLSAVLKQFVKDHPPRKPAGFSGTGVYRFAESPLKEKFKQGVKFDSNGYPDFSPYVYVDPKGRKAIVKIEMQGNHNHGDGDYGRANLKFFGSSAENAVEENYTWHHHQDRQTMLLVDYELHKNVAHSGGASIIRLIGPLKIKRRV